jgi:hypothetical protein
MTDHLTQLANDAITLLAPLLPAAATAAGKLADHVADGFLSEPGAKLFDWIASQFKDKPAAASLQRAIAEPRNQHRLDALRIEILELAEKDAQFREQLGELVNAGAKANISATQIASPSGDNSKIGQATGKNISIQIS